MWHGRPQIGLQQPLLVNVISVVFVFHHAVSAHPLCQPASLSPGIIYPPSAEHMGHTRSLSLCGTTPCLSQSRCPVFWAEWCNALPPPIGLRVIFDRVHAIWHGGVTMRAGVTMEMAFPKHRELAGCMARLLTQRLIVWIDENNCISPNWVLLPTFPLAV